MTDENKKKIYEAARIVCMTAVCGWDAEIDEDNFEEIVDEELIAVIEEIFDEKIATMIHIKTKTGEALINEQNVAIVEYDREHKSVLVVLNRQSSGGKHRYKIGNVEEFEKL